MPSFSINALAEMTGRTNRTVKKRVERLSPAGKEGRAVLYDAKEALEAILWPDAPGGSVDEEFITLEEARRNESLAKTEKIKLEMESIRKQRIPLELVTDAIDEAFGAIKAVVKRSKMKAKEKDDCLRELREFWKKLKW